MVGGTALEHQQVVAGDVCFVGQLIHDVRHVLCGIYATLNSLLFDVRGHLLCESAGGSVRLL